VFRHLTFEISDLCNAYCPWCITGLLNLSKDRERSFKRIDYQEFTRAIEHLESHGLLAPDATVALYIWGEPLLNPDWKRIVTYLSRKGHGIHIATNCSVKIDVKPDEDVDFSGIRFFGMSMPGFSQESYDKIHRFKFERIKRNIASNVSLLRSHPGFDGELRINFHVYQFNEDELRPAYLFARRLGVAFNPYYATINNLEQYMSYLDGSIPVEQLREIAQSLNMSYVAEALKHRPADYECPQLELLTMNASCDVLTCCAVGRKNPSYAVGNLFDLTSDELRTKKLEQEYCGPCHATGLAHLVHTLKAPPADSYRISWRSLREELGSRRLVPGLARSERTGA
jgi:MoaA/NifB/PqqE/SkfB family radical SAM enzyme